MNIHEYPWITRNIHLYQLISINIQWRNLLKLMPQLFWCWKAPRDLPAQKPPMSPLDMYDDTGMACLSCKFHVMSYMDMMPQSWQDIPCSDMTCHTWTCHGHGTSCHVPISCDHDMTSSTWSRSCSPLMFNHSFLEDWFQNSFRFRRAGRLSILAVKMWNGGIYNGIEHCHIFGFFSLQQLFLDSFPHILERYSFGVRFLHQVFYKFLRFFLEVSLIRGLIFLLWHSCGGRTVSQC